MNLCITKGIALGLGLGLCSMASAANFTSINVRCDNQQDFGEDELYVLVTIDGKSQMLKRGITGGSRANPKRMQTGSDWSFSPELLKQMSFSNNVEITLMEKDLTQRTDDVLAYFTIKSSDTQGSDSQSGQVDGKKYAYSIDWSL